MAGRGHAPPARDAREAGHGACWPIRAPKRCRRASRRSGCGCRTSTRSSRTRCCIPSFDNELAESYKRETELFFDSIVREDRNVLDLLTADYAFVNERDRQGLPHPEHHRRRVPARARSLDENRRGLLGQGSMLMQTSIADRTSPVQRGKWIMEVLLGSPPPAPPPNVPPLEDTKAATDAGKNLSVARTDGGAPQEPGLRVVPSRHRSARALARQLRRRRRVADQGQRRQRRYDRQAVRRHRVDRPGEPAAGAARITRT